MQVGMKTPKSYWKIKTKKGRKLSIFSAQN